MGGSFILGASNARITKSRDLSRWPVDDDDPFFFLLLAVLLVLLLNLVGFPLGAVALELWNRIVVSVRLAVVGRRRPRLPGVPMAATAAAERRVRGDDMVV